MAGQAVVSQVGEGAERTGQTLVAFEAKVELRAARAVL